MRGSASILSDADLRSGVIQFTQYESWTTDLSGRWRGLPQWARFIVFLFALPGLVLAGLSILALAVSILALFLLALPVYVALRSLTSGNRIKPAAAGPVELHSPGAKRVEATVVE